MKIQFLGGGLGNQILQYVFARYLERTIQEKVFLDDLYFYSDGVSHNGYELEKVFGLKVNLLSGYLGKEIWKVAVAKGKQGVGIPQLILETGVPMVMLEGDPDHYHYKGKTIRIIDSEFEVENMLFNNVYFFAYWTNSKWFYAHENENRQELRFPDIKEDFVKEYEYAIKNSYSVGIHVRLGDFVKLGWDIPTERYRKACIDILENHPDAHFFIFSNELEWCKIRENELGFDLSPKTVYVENNTRENSYVDMQLLSMCKGIVRNAKSTFSQVAGWLNPNLEFDIKLKP